MKVVILAGGLGTRISEESHLKPKPMIEIGGRPILWHIMKYYSEFGFHEFVICLGYKQYVVKEYFAEQLFRAVEGNSGGYGTVYHDRRKGEADSAVYRRRALYADLRRRGM